MKLFKHILNILIWTILGLYLLLMLTISVPSVQEYLGGRVASLLAGKLGTSVSIGRLDYGFFSHVTLYDVNIKDQQGQDMLKAERLSTRLDLLSLTEGKVSISTAQLFGVHARFYQATKNSKPNFQFVLDSLASKDTTQASPINLRVNSLIMRRSSVSFDRLDAPETPGQLNPNHLAVTDISTHLVLKQLSEDSLNLTVKRLSFKEKSGMEVKRLSLHFDGGRYGSRLQDFRLLMPGTEVTFGDIVATYRFRGRHFVMPSLQYHGSILPSSVRLSDVSYLLPGLKDFQSTLSLSADFHGEGETLEVPHLQVGSTTGDVDINLGGTIQQLFQREPSWRADIHDFGLSAKTISFISENLQGQQVQVPEVLTRMGSIHLTGSLHGRGLSDCHANNILKTDAGEVTLQLALDGDRNFTGKVDTHELDLKRLLDDDHFGVLTTTIDVSGQLPSGGQPEVKADGVIERVSYNGYQYQNIKLNGLYSARDTHGRLSIDDANLKADIEGVLLTSRRQRDVKLRAVLSDFSPQATHISDTWGDARFSGVLQADFTATDLNDAVGSIDIQDVTMLSSSERYELHNLRIESDYAEQHYIALWSDFGDALITGHFDYETLAQSITNFVAAKLPTLPGLPKVNPNTDNNFAINATIHKSDWLEQLLRVPLHLTKPLTLHGMVNDQSQQLNIECDIPQFYYKDSRYDRGHLSILSPLGTLAYDVKVTKLMGDGDNLDLQLSGSAYNNLLTTTLLWDDHAEERMCGKVTAQAQFHTTLDGKQETAVTIAPSTMTINNAQWDIHPCGINYTDKRLAINHFSVQRGEQFLTLDGIASESGSDSISVQMKDVDVEYVLNLVNFHAVEFSGLATGGGYLRGVFGDFQANGEVTVRQFQFQHGRMGTLHALVAWNDQQEQIDISGVCDDGEDAQTLVDGYVSPARNFIDLGIRANGTHLDFARSFMDSFISSLEGHGYGDIRLMGPLDHLNLTGQLAVNGRAHVSTLGCDYDFRNDTIRLVPNEIEIVHFPVYDRHGTQALMSGAIHHDELTNLTFDLYVDADNLLAYDFHDFGGDTFYGTVYASGHVGIHGRERGVDIEADVTPQANTVFVYNAASPDAINNQEFIEWGTDHGDGSPTGRSVALQSNDHSRLATTDQENRPHDPTIRDDLTMRLNINATPEAQVRLLMDPATNDYITLQGTGMLQATYYNKGGFTMQGTYRVTEGTYGLTIQNVIRKNFTFREGGTITFGGDPYDAILNLRAQHVVNGVSLSDLNVGASFSNTVRVNCLMDITGQPRQPIIGFDLEMPNVNADEQQMVRSLINSEEEMNQQVIYLLAVGRFYPQGSNNADASGDSPSKTSLAMQSLLSGTLSGQINNMLGQIVKSNKWNFGANISTGDEGWNNAEYEGIVNGRLLNNRLLINGQFGYRDNATTANSSFIGDFDISYLLTPTGSFALKVYNQTNDRYFTRSSLNTQGVGIILKKDFSSLPDLFGVRKKKKK